MQNVSYFNPLDTAFSETRRLLFAPFNLGRWFMLGFSAWLAMLGESGGSVSLPGNWQQLAGKSGAGNPDDIGAFIQAHLAAIILFGSIIFVLALALGIVFLWINSRGKFMFLDNLVRGLELIAEPWQRFRARGNSLFLWRLLFTLIVLSMLLLIFAGAAALAVPDIRSGHFRAGAIGALAGGTFLLVAVSIVAAYIQVFLGDFVVPLMWKYDLTATEGWRQFGALYRQNRGLFIRYGLMRFLIHIGTAAAVTMACLLTCCCGLILLMIPYVNAVALLPVSVFVRVYSLHFFRQFGPEFDMTSVEPPPLAA